MIYVTDASQLSLLAIDGKTNTVVAQIKLGAAPFGIAINPRTNRIYVRASPLQPDIHVAVINGATNKVLTRIPTDATSLLGMVADPRTNMIYAAAAEPSSMLVINGQTNTVTASIGVTGLTVAANPVTNTIYQTNQVSLSGPGLVYVINGQTNTVTTTVTVQDPNGIAADPRTGFVYVANTRPGNVVVINGQTNKVAATVPVGSLPQGVAADPQTNTVYVAVQGSSSVAVLAGAG
jgi:YVTN family beta-propeller protein